MNERVRDDLRYLTFESFEPHHGLSAAVMTRHGGVSTGPYSSLNLGGKTGDDPNHVRENRARMAALFRRDPRQLAFARQVQIACDTAKLAASRVTGKEAPSHADHEATLEDLRARVRSTLAYLETFSAKDFEGAATRSVTQPRWEGKTMSGADYFIEHAVPNFFFHLSHVYAILRHNGVNLGKKDYLGTLSLRAP